MSAWLELIPVVEEEYHTLDGEYSYTGFSLLLKVYINWDNGEYNTAGAKLTYRIGGKGAYGTGFTFNEDKKQSGREYLGSYYRSYSANGNSYSSSNILCEACYEAISTTFTQTTFPARNLHGYVKTYMVEHYSIDEGNTLVRIECEDDLGMSNRKWAITDYYGNVVIQGDYKGSAGDSTICYYYWYPNSSANVAILDKLYEFSRYDASRDILIFEGKIQFTGTYGGKTYISEAPAYFESKGKHPTAVVDIYDTDAKTIALTGDRTKMIRYFSDMYISAVWTAYGTTIASTTIKYNVNKTATNVNSVNCTDIIDSKCTFSATDARGLSSTISQTPTLIPYTKLTCTFQPTMTLEGKVSFTTSGNFFNSNFGASSNTLALQYRYKKTGGAYSSWITIAPTITANNYECTVSFNLPNFEYKDTYVFQVKAIDALMEITTPEYTVNATPIFDWSKSDFNFNVPVSINGSPVYVEELLYNDYGNEDRNSCVISGNFSDYDYVEIYFTDNNGVGWGYTKVFEPEDGKQVCLSLVESATSSGGFYLRHTKYKIQNDNEFVVVFSAYQYCSGTSWIKYEGNLIKIKRVVGFRGFDR